MRFALRLSTVLGLLAVAAFVSSEPAPRLQVGPLAAGGFLLNSGWRLTPAGRQLPLDTFPMSLAPSPDGRYLLALNAGYLPPSVSVIDAAAEREIERVPIKDGWNGLAFSRAGDRLYVGGGSEACVFEFRFRNGQLQPARRFVIVPEPDRKPQDFAGDVALSPDGRLLYAAIVHRDAVAVFDVESGLLLRRFPTGRRPYRLRFGADRTTLYVSAWADAAVCRHNAETGAELGRIAVGAHPTDLVFLGSRLFVACANTNAVYVVESGRVVERVNVSLTPRQPVGMTPSALAPGPDGKTLYVVCSDANAVAVVDVSRRESRVRGFVPVGWYPTAAKALEDGRLVVLNSRGVRSFANPGGPNPGRTGDDEFIARLQLGTAGFIPRFDGRKLAGYTATVMENCPYRDARLDNAGTPQDSPIPARPGVASPIRHVLYIVKENRTYDQVLGDIKQGLGDPALTLFGEDVTPNQHKLAREFVLFDNFYVNADVSADGHNWSTAAISPDYVQKMWGTSYGGRRRSHDYYGPGDPAAGAPGGYIWNRAAAAGLSMRNYGYYVENRREPAPDGNVVAAVGDPTLAKVTCPTFRGFDLNYPEYLRAGEFLRELAGFEKAGEMPRFMVMHLGRNHTAGTAPGRISPRAMVADNDYAAGLIVEAISKSRFWKDTAIFIVEDDAQNGPDHIDAHRSTLFVASPYARRGVVDSTMYNTASVLRTMELILGVAPMTHFDAGATPMTGAFQSAADLRPFTAEKPRISLEEKNPPRTAHARMTFDRPDEMDDDELNEELWRALRPGVPMPAPVRSRFALGQAFSRVERLEELPTGRGFRR